MKLKKAVFLFLALLFPVCIFVFLKYFGKNEFTVPALFADVHPEGISDCGITIMLPYHIPDSVQESLQLPKDSLILIHFGEDSTESQQQLTRVKHEYGNEMPLKFLHASDSISYLRKCIFFLTGGYDLVLLDGDGVIRGQYKAGDREEVDRLLMEIAILLKRY
jgi:hypothetical protein